MGMLRSNTLDYNDVIFTIGVPQLAGSFVLRRFMALQCLLVTVKFNHDMTLTCIATCAYKSPGSYDKAASKLRKCYGVCCLIFFIFFRISERYVANPIAAF